MSQIHVKNHFVPEVYLKRWLNSEDKIWEYNLLVAHQNVPEWKTLSISGTGYQKHLYTQLVSDVESDHFETWFCKEFESPANDVIEKVISESSLTVDDWRILIRFLAAQDVRTPARLNEYMQWAQKEYPKLLQDALDNLEETLKGSATDFKKESNIKNPEKFPLRIVKAFDENKKAETLQLETYIGRGSWLRFIKHLLEETHEILHHHKWSIVKPAKGFQWFTSDNPVIKLNFSSETDYDLQGGWGKRNGNIIFPLSPEHIMLVEIGRRSPLKYSRLTSEKTTLIRKLISENAHRKIFHYKKDDEILKFRKRVVDQDQLKREKERLEKWHDDNSKIEREYASKSRPTN